MCKGSWGNSEGPQTIPAYLRLMRREEYRSLLPPVPWIMRGENALMSFGALVMILLLTLIARFQWGF